MDAIKRIIDEASGSIPSHSKTALAISAGAGPEEIAAFATGEGLHELAGAIFKALQIGETPSSNALDIVRQRLLDFRKDLPANSETAKLIDAGAPLDEISENAEEEGLFSLVAMLVEAEQEGER
jgi:hypothetical protein